MKRLSKIAALLITLTMFRVASADSPLADAVEKKDHAAIRKLLEKNIDVNASQTDGMTALLWAAYQDDLATLFITSDVSVHTGDAVGDDSDATVFNDPTGRARIEVHRVKAGKCPRCWRWVVPPGGAGDPDTTICKRCRDALATTVTTTV